jgi:outer membrane protein assembly factor BamA
MTGLRLKNIFIIFPYPYQKTARLFLNMLALLFLAGCSGTAKLPAGKRLYTGATVKLESKEKIADESALAAELTATITPKPNTSFLGMRPGLFFYNLAGTPKKGKGLRSFIKNKLGEAPVFYDSMNAGHIANLMVNRLNNAGYFNSTVGYKENVKDKTVSLTYTAQVAKPYTIANIFYPQGDTLAPVYRDIAAAREASLLKVGENYNLGKFTAERVRVDAELKNKGYYYFDPDFILYKIDTTQNNYTLNIYPTIKPEAPEKAVQPHKIGDIYIYTDYNLNQDSNYTNPPVRIKGGYQYFPDEESLKAKHLLPAIFLEKNDIYSRRNHALTISRLMGLSLFRYVEVQFRDSDSIPNMINAYLRLTPSRLQSLRAEVEMVNKSNGFAGPGFNARYRHRNLMRGAEQLQVNFNISQESQVGGGKNNDDTPTSNSSNGLNSFVFGTQAELNVPRFMTPFNLTNLRTEFVPQTKFTLGYSYMNRVDYFQMNGYNATYGYVWRPRPRITHEITPINLQFARLSNVGPQFQERLDRNLYLRRSFEEQFIIGSMYNFTYNTQNQQKHDQDFYFNANIDLSGNLLSLFTSKIQGQTEIPNTLVKQPFSQYSRLALETRYYKNLTRASRLAARMIVGAGIPYSNSQTLPYIKQFFIGGSNSIRAFRPREVGPGTYSVTTDPNQASVSNGFFDQTGDIKFETNVEYRFDIIPFLKGAVFVDAGNIWLARESEDRPGGEFVFSKALSQLAVGTGAGLRIDAEFFVLRFDLGIPVRDPIQESPYVFTLPPQRKNMVLHIAVGYPF